MAGAPPDFVKFPRTPHLFALGESLPRGDKLVSPSEARELLKRPVTVEEKVDGACIGISVVEDGQIRVQSRGRYLERGEGGQFTPVWPWLALHQESLLEGLGSHLILFGEWCYARHTVFYDGLPDWLLAFDVYDCRATRFLSRERRDAVLARIGVSDAPFLAHGVFDRSGLLRLMSRSKIGSVEMEGLYLRWDDGDWLSARAKVVRAGWVQADDEHWSRRRLETNRLRVEIPEHTLARSL